MLNKLLTKMSGQAADVETLHTAIVQLDAVRASTVDEIAEIKEGRHQALIDDESNAAVDRVERQIETAELYVKRIDHLSLPQRFAEAAARTAPIEKARCAHRMDHFLRVEQAAPNPPPPSTMRPRLQVPTFRARKFHRHSAVPGPKTEYPDNAGAGPPNESNQKLFKHDFLGAPC